MMKQRVTLCVATVTFAAVLQTSCGLADDADPVFSGPQVGEKLNSFTTRGVLGELADKEFDLVARAGDQPLVIVFMHKLTRPSAALTRVVLNYAAEHKVAAGLVFLSEDATATEAQIKRAAHALPKVPVGISTDGSEGPGAYGLNRNVTLTVIVGKAGKVTANFALVQPSEQADGPKIGRQIALAAGRDVTPTLAEMGIKNDAEGSNPRMAQDPNLRRLLAPLIQKNATPEGVKQAAARIEAYALENQPARKQIGDIARRIVRAGILEKYGTPPAQEFLRKWAESFDPPQPARSIPPDVRPDAEQ